MTDAMCRPVAQAVPGRERERREDRLGDLLECLADLVVATGEQRAAIEQLAGRSDEPARHVLERMAELERKLKQVGIEAATVHQLLQHEHLI
jgi:hypothetical protein